MGREREPNCTRDGRMLTKLIENMLIRTCSSAKNLKKRERIFTLFEVENVMLKVIKNESGTSNF